MGLSAHLSALLLSLSLLCSAVNASPSHHVALTARDKYDMIPPGSEPINSGVSSWWFAAIRRQGRAPFTDDGGYKVFRNIRDYGAKGDGHTDDTEAINRAIAEGPRCGQGCDSNTITPAIVYFPPGDYRVSKPIIPLYYTQLVGDFVRRPTIRPLPGFDGIAVIDSDPYADGGVNWWTNQNNFFRQVRNLKIDLTALPMTTGTGIHWQVGQATSLQNIDFIMHQDRSRDNKQQGIFMDNGSGGFMSDLTFIGGRYGAFLGNQQFTTRNLKFFKCNTAIYMNWNWVWTFHGLHIEDCAIGIDMAQGNAVQTVGSVIVLDSTFKNTHIGIATAYNPTQVGTNGTLVLDNVDMEPNVDHAVLSVAGQWKTILGGNTHIDSWVQGRAYKGGLGMAVQGQRQAVVKPHKLLDEDGHIFTKSKPQYENTSAVRFVSVKSKGAKGDGKTDDTAVIQQIFDLLDPDDIVYFDHGAYVVTNTIRLPKNVKIVGEIWPLILAAGNHFRDPSNPQPVFKIGKKGDEGNVEIQDLMFETLGPLPGAILMEINVKGETRGEKKGSVGLFDVHFRVGGSAGTDLQMDKCVKNPSVVADPKPECIGSFMMLHIRPWASAYLENVWMWTADHELDKAPYTQINIFNGRGILIESTEGTWLWGTASEHNVLSNYQLHKASNVFMGLIQSETAYFQGNPDARKPFTANATYGDADFSQCRGPTCARTWGLRINDSKGVLVYGGGLYSFFDNYDQKCVAENNCQENMIGIYKSQVEMFGISTKASVNMISVNGVSAVKDSDNRNNFCAAVAAFTPAPE
ncbi:hypothetical protein XA68_10261 [Ophiocordyceps unilateralis]|uniref:Rhamnogalacturonase A/B/Epimerase-like pectate lyase domain-containing protein n=1 Tax=Ophiocordyceps unilateralis TaxID=268505 RepID=A0A2A9P2Z9_OPHUN|nr:hypothetical protein XA68_10261 [Ophiocordyceps unilateralis]